MPGEQNPKMPPQTITREQLQQLLSTLMAAQPPQEPVPEDLELQKSLEEQQAAEAERKRAEQKARMRQMLAPLPSGMQKSIESTDQSLEEMQRLMDEEAANKNRL